MPSSRMRTVRCSGRLGEGGVCLGGGSVWRGPPEGGLPGWGVCLEGVSA